ncbi:unnamed protein product [Allacma fusca]|uniref:C2 domain-containing protein n=1 Tax=Allacma fusca TaxID=39272 RepID=A0A8J2Q115_9HEXA|nr:unnamed protein product [Allacma fusca]
MGRATFLVLATILAAGCVSALTRVEIMLSARDLPDYDICCSSPVLPPDGYAVVYFAPSNLDDYFEEGTTTILSNNNNPNWPEVFSFNVAEGNTTARLRAVLWDSDVDDDDYMGSAEINIADIISAFGHSVTRSLQGAPKGDGKVVVTARVNGTLVHVPVDSGFRHARHLNYKSLNTRT